ncbi:hypothetical protein F1C10_14765 [Sphingomonas sp. NBWT7]|uniref:hypothetical protein n=1 Tax=Sphingomonas sp. NBWT7 TaxID=2596913 RepID=UPI0016238A71|nr:hypothetical protein [Sphingomonas sp. NBWT7]QNE33053.1 hypothetical protein F1C10_14765 [Sphingomonas sp. NBWT7]
MRQVGWRMIGWIALAALAACDSTPAAPEAAEVSPKDAELAETTRLCASIGAISKGGDDTLRGAFISTPYANEYGGTLIDELTKAGGYRYEGAEMVRNTCYAYAIARGSLFGRSHELAWRCPVKMLSDSPTEPGKTEIEAVEDRECDLDTRRGDPFKRAVEVEIIHS